VWLLVCGDRTTSAPPAYVTNKKRESMPASMNKARSESEFPVLEFPKIMLLLLATRLPGSCLRWVSFSWKLSLACNETCICILRKRQVPVLGCNKCNRLDKQMAVQTTLRTGLHNTNDDNPVLKRRRFNDRQPQHRLHFWDQCRRVQDGAIERIQP
jgi:hypothetical protein